MKNYKGGVSEVIKVDVNDVNVVVNNEYIITEIVINDELISLDNITLVPKPTKNPRRIEG